MEVDLLESSLRLELENRTGFSSITLLREVDESNT